MTLRETRALKAKAKLIAEMDTIETEYKQLWRREIEIRGRLRQIDEVLGYIYETTRPDRFVREPTADEIEKYGF